ncbi:MAG: CocE/NonD family hydrolase [Alphaproteobacteria bacterium]|nr:CocE/NonD family hydrolase [Alphaproteobacteria bacterium]
MLYDRTPENGIVVSEDVMVPMADGVRLATDVYRPAAPDGSAKPGRFPVILTRTSYDKSNPVMQVEPVARFFTRRGYVTVVQDLRGRGKSEGHGQYFHVANKREGLDGADTIAWIAAQEWSDGRVGMVGSSHSGIVQNVAAFYKPPALKALWVDVCPTSAFDWEARTGGAQALQMFAALFLHGWDVPEIQDDAEAKRRIEEGVENMRTLLVQGPWKEGGSPLTVVPNLEQILMRYQNNGIKDAWWMQEVLEHKAYFDRFADIPCVVSSGWFDPFVADVAGQYIALSKRLKSPQRLVLGPWGHAGMRAGGSASIEVDFGSGADWGYRVYNAERLRWFDRWLKDMPTAVEKDAPVHYFEMGGGSGERTKRGHFSHGGSWRDDTAWPPTGMTPTPYYLAGNRALSTRPAEASPIAWTHDPDHPVPTIGGAVAGFLEWVKVPEGMDAAYISPRARMRTVVPDGPMHQKERPNLVGCKAPFPLLANRPDVLVFQTDPLPEDLVIAGPIEARIWVASSAVDTDVTVKLLDVSPPTKDEPEGFHMLLCDSIRRARFRKGYDKEELLKPGEVVEYVVELPPVANRFRKGHRIRVDIASSNFPRFDVNPGTGEPLGRHTKKIKATNTLHLDKAHPSRIVLPVMKG